MILKAAAFAAHAHRDQKRKYSGEPYINHPLRVAAILENVGLVFPDLLAATMLHDVVEDCGVSLGVVDAFFGTEVARIVNGVTNPSASFPEGTPNRPNRAARKAMDRAHLAVGDGYIHSLKLADMIDNLDSIIEEDKNFAVVYVKEKNLLLPLLKNGHPELKSRVAEILQNASQTLFPN